MVEGGGPKRMHSSTLDVDLAAGPNEPTRTKKDAPRGGRFRPPRPLTIRLRVLPPGGASSYLRAVPRRNGDISRTESLLSSNGDKGFPVFATIRTIIHRFHRNRPQAMWKTTRRAS